MIFCVCVFFLAVVLSSDQDFFKQYIQYGIDILVSKLNISNDESFIRFKEVIVVFFFFLLCDFFALRFLMLFYCY
jgi:hypothetical protein